MGAIEDLESAEKLLRKRATEATPGPWERPLDTRSKSIVGAALPAGENPGGWIDGIIPAEFSSYGGHENRHAGQRERQRSGCDLEYIALVDPDVGLAIADWILESIRAIGFLYDGEGEDFLEKSFASVLKVSRSILRDKNEGNGNSVPGGS